MPAKCLIAQTPIEHVMRLLDVLDALRSKRLISRSQHFTILTQLRPRLPLARVTISQRTALGVTYVETDGYAFAVNHRAKLI